MKRLKELKDIEKIHFVGIGGAGMSPLAKIMVELGYEVTGSDRADSEVIQNLQKLGAKITLDGQKGKTLRVPMPLWYPRPFPLTTRKYSRRATSASASYTAPISMRRSSMSTRVLP